MSWQYLGRCGTSSSSLWLNCWFSFCDALKRAKKERKKERDATRRQSLALLLLYASWVEEWGGQVQHSHRLHLIELPPLPDYFAFFFFITFILWHHSQDGSRTTDQSWAGQWTLLRHHEPVQAEGIVTKMNTALSDSNVNVLQLQSNISIRLEYQFQCWFIISFFKKIIQTQF